MPSPESNERPSSTTWTWVDRRVRVPAGGQKQRPEGTSKRFRLPQRNPRKPLTIVVKYRGGSECWWELRARGAVLRRPGVTALHDALSDLQGTLRTDSDPSTE